MKKYSFFFFFALLFGALLPGMTTASHDGKVVIANDLLNVHYPYKDRISLAMDWGYFAQYGFDEDFLETGSTAYECAALQSRSSQFAWHAYPLKSCPDDVVAVAAVSYRANYHLIVRKDATNVRGEPIETVADLGGTKLLAYGCGIDGVGLSSRLFYDLVTTEVDGLEFACTTPSDLHADTVYIVTLAGSQGWEFHVRMIVDGKDGIIGGLVSTKSALQLLRTGKFKILVGPDELTRGERQVPVALLTTTPTFNREHRDIVEQMVAVFRATEQHLREKPEEAKELLQEYYPDATEDDVAYIYEMMLRMTHPDLCTDPEEIKRGIRFYAMKSKEELPLDGTIDLVGCDK